MRQGHQKESQVPCQWRGARGQQAAQHSYLLSRKTRAVMPEEPSSLLQHSTPSMASHTCKPGAVSTQQESPRAPAWTAPRLTSSRPLLRPTTMRLPCSSKLHMEPSTLGAQAREGEPFSGEPPSSSGARGSIGPGEGGRRVGVRTVGSGSSWYTCCTRRLKS